jgi:hypothetical protein
MDPYNSSTWTPQYAWGQYGGVANSAIGAGPTPAQYGNNLQQYYNSNLGVLQPSLAAMIQQQYKNLGHGRSPLVNQAAALQMMNMAYTPAYQSAASAESYARQMQAAAAQAAMRYPYGGSSYNGYQRYDDGRGTYDNPWGGEYRYSGGLPEDKKSEEAAKPWTGIQDTTKGSAGSGPSGSPNVSGAQGGSTNPVASPGSNGYGSRGTSTYGVGENTGFFDNSAGQGGVFSTPGGQSPPMMGQPTMVPTGANQVNYSSGSVGDW